MSSKSSATHPRTRKQTLEREVSDRLKVNDYTTQCKAAIADLEGQKLSLVKEINESREKHALADTLTNFLTRKSDYDFNQFFFYVEKIKKMSAREGKISHPNLQVAIIEEQIRSLALKAFQGDLVSKEKYAELLHEKENIQNTKRELETKISDLEASLGEEKKNLESASREKSLLEAIKADFEGRSTTLGELKNWVLSTFNEEIEKRVAEKLMTFGVAAFKGLEFAYRKITRQDNT